ncbi:hypothetical protein DM02DRAFT_626896 [Periconia macrospinosa]|uniref:Uncharacterized protein n=1 Tax=Periconia macrospinosa TaxID=97972 RepID=A0A2V1DV57_9PLEO|nr:hypothetical protein DM02DRAFT_626896 [Periconia macrospinosa]
MRLIAVLLLVFSSLLQASPHQTSAFIRPTSVRATPGMVYPTARPPNFHPTGFSSSRLAPPRPYPTSPSRYPYAPYIPNSPYDPLSPRSGCRPEGCFNCTAGLRRPFVSSISRFNTTSGKEIQTSINYGITLTKTNPKYTGPSNNTEAGMKKWVKDIYASPHNDFYESIYESAARMRPNTSLATKPVALSTHWTQFKYKKFMTVSGVAGCAFVVVANRNGIWISRHWQSTVDDVAFTEFPALFENAFTNALKPNAPITKHNFTAQDAQLRPNAVRQIEDTWSYKNGWFPHPGWFLDNRTTIPAQQPQAAVFVWEGGKERGSTFNQSGPAMQNIVKNTWSSLNGAVKLVKYKLSLIGSSPYSWPSVTIPGIPYEKIIVSCDWETKTYSVWMAGNSVTEPIMTVITFIETQFHICH